MAALAPICSSLCLDFLSYASRRPVEHSHRDETASNLARSAHYSPQQFRRLSSLFLALDLFLLCQPCAADFGSYFPCRLPFELLHRYPSDNMTSSSSGHVRSCQTGLLQPDHMVDYPYGHLYGKRSTERFCYHRPTAIQCQRTYLPVFVASSRACLSLSGSCSIIEVFQVIKVGMILERKLL